MLGKMQNKVHVEMYLGPRLSDNATNKLAENQRKTDADRYRVTDKADRATTEQVLDPRTRMILFKLVSKNIVKQINGCISTGKEANVYHAVNDDGEEMAIKVYKTSILVFKDRDKYVTGEFRFRRGYAKHNPRKMVKVWAEKEVRNLTRLHMAKIPCPEPLLLRNHVLVMRFLGHDGWPAPRLKDASITPDKAHELYYQCIRLVRDMYHMCHLVHADLSEYNMLYYKSQLYIIDVSQSVEHDHPHALNFLRKDLTNVTDFFRKHQVSTMTLRELFDFVTDVTITADNIDLYLEKVQELTSQRSVTLTAEQASEEQVFREAFIPRTLDDVTDFERDFQKMKLGQGEEVLGCRFFFCQNCFLSFVTQRLVSSPSLWQILYQTLTGMKTDLTGAQQQPVLLQSGAASEEKVTAGEAGHVDEDGNDDDDDDDEDDDDDDADDDGKEGGNKKGAKPIAGLPDPSTVSKAAIKAVQRHLHALQEAQASSRKPRRRQSIAAAATAATPVRSRRKATEDLVPGSREAKRRREEAVQLGCEALVAAVAQVHGHDDALVAETAQAAAQKYVPSVTAGTVAQIRLQCTAELLPILPDQTPQLLGTVAHHKTKDILATMPGVTRYAVQQARANNLHYGVGQIAQRTPATPRKSRPLDASVRAFTLDHSVPSAHKTKVDPVTGEAKPIVYLETSMRKMHEDAQKTASCALGACSSALYTQESLYSSGVFLKTDFAATATEPDPTKHYDHPFHCLAFGLDDCQQQHHLGVLSSPQPCPICTQGLTTLADLSLHIDAHLPQNPGECADMQTILERGCQTLQQWVAHLLRSAHTRSLINKTINNLGPGQAVFLCDFKDWILIIHHLQAVFAVINSLITEGRVPPINTASVVTDAGAHYVNSPFSVFLSSKMHTQASFDITDLWHFEAGEGKSRIDLHFAHVSAKFSEFMKGGNSIHNGMDVEKALATMPGMTVHQLHIDEATRRRLQKVPKSIPTLDQAGHIVYNNGGMQGFRLSDRCMLFEYTGERLREVYRHDFSTHLTLGQQNSPHWSNNAEHHAQIRRERDSHPETAAVSPATSEAAAVSPATSETVAVSAATSETAAVGAATPETAAISPASPRTPSNQVPLNGSLQFTPTMLHTINAAPVLMKGTKTCGPQSKTRKSLVFTPPTPSKSPNLQCPKCSKLYKSSAWLSRHIQDCAVASNAELGLPEDDPGSELMGTQSATASNAEEVATTDDSFSDEDEATAAASSEGASSAWVLTCGEESSPEPMTMPASMRALSAKASQPLFRHDFTTTEPQLAKLQSLFPAGEGFVTEPVPDGELRCRALQIDFPHVKSWLAQWARAPPTNQPRSLAANSPRLETDEVTLDSLPPNARWGNDSENEELPSWTAAGDSDFSVTSPSRSPRQRRTRRRVTAAEED
ncbi:Atypical/RIO/RIO1 protein kinase, variant 2 [Capsaspora owczarzaki ATCC 30864]|nr:Atypical/RIO/RIO1 protein kinase, variant 2 [Capsaspora owczarzaki ATCC 30864]